MSKKNHTNPVSGEETPQMKTCTKCKTPKELTLFYKDKYSKDGHMGVCKACDNEYQKTWREKKKAKAEVKVEEVPVVLG